VLSIVATIVVIAVAGLAVSAWLTRGGSHSPGPRATQIRLIQPFDLYGKLRAPYRPSVTLQGGSCINSSKSSDVGSLRCFSGRTAADPCWQSATETGAVTVACLTSPWDPRVILIVNARVSAMPGASIAAVPWAMEIIQPGHPGNLLQCRSDERRAGSIAGKRVNWTCFHPGQANAHALAGHALGFPNIATSHPWTVSYVPVNSTHAVEATVASIWP
jgi:hypothetical protein